MQPKTRYINGLSPLQTYSSLPPAPYHLMADVDRTALQMVKITCNTDLTFCILTSPIFNFPCVIPTMVNNESAVGEMLFWK